MSSSRERSESASESSVTPSTSAAETQAAKIARRRGRPMAMDQLYRGARAVRRHAACPGQPRRPVRGRNGTAMTGPVLFDFGGTLDADGEPWGERMYRGYRAAGGRAAPDAFDAGFRE